MAILTLSSRSIGSSLRLRISWMWADAWQHDVSFKGGAIVVVVELLPLRVLLSGKGRCPLADAVAKVAAANPKLNICILSIHLSKSRFPVSFGYDTHILELRKQKQREF